MITLRLALVVLCAAGALGLASEGFGADERQRPMNAEETRAFMRKLAGFVEEHHLKKDEKSAQRGMIYEYFDVRKKQWVQGEALDTMHDGAWFGAGMVAAYQATGDEYYKQFLVRWQLPFYLKMLNHGDELFSAKVNHAR